MANAGDHDFSDLTASENVRRFRPRSTGHENITTIANSGAGTRFVHGTFVFADANVRDKTPVEEQIARALMTFSSTSFWSPSSTEPKRWCTDAEAGNNTATSSNRRSRSDQIVEAWIGTGSGQFQAPLSTTRQDFIELVGKADFSPAFLKRLVNRCSLFEHRFSSTRRKDKILELGMSTYENDAFTLLLRYNISQKSLKAIIFLKQPRDGVNLLDQFTEFLDLHVDEIRDNPLLLPVYLLSFFQLQSVTDYPKWRADLYALESELGVTVRKAAFERAGYDGVSSNYDELNARVAWLSAIAADATLSVSTTLSHAQGLLRIAELVGTNNENDKNGDDLLHPLQEEIRSTILRAELYLKNAAMVDTNLQSMRAVLFNKITKRDTDSMKTIAVVTLFFLPSTFVSAVFSTGVFNFFADEESQEGGSEKKPTISRWAWVYLLTCLLLTTATVLFWLCWYFWGDIWLRKLHLPRNQAGQSRKALNNVNRMDKLRTFPASLGPNKIAHDATADATADAGEQQNHGGPVEMPVFGGSYHTNARHQDTSGRYGVEAQIQSPYYSGGFVPGFSPVQPAMYSGGFMHEDSRKGLFGL
ncbi:hypothetical protein QBC35DRAFT_493265 [Podospora australis]|uniref:Mg2+ transporter protein, CorA-like/Zinc transport protein ZntB n=1 Tax=Podospora australis TaxID=1536484 RepID=A0AAN6WWJ0_9PEZI|nr:hypothetical protein QBC35DRAFT_493265 [Podospora australis]